MDLKSVIAPMALDEFVAAISRSCAPVFVPGSADKFESLFSEADYWRSIDQGKPEGRSLPRVSLSSFQLPLAFERGVISRALRSGNTVCISHMDRALSLLRRLCLDAEAALGLPGSACIHCYNSPRGTGYDYFHMDSGAAVTLQIAGTKTWQYAERPAVPWSIRVGGYREGGRLEWFGETDWSPKPGTFPSPEDQGLVERTLSPGDLLVMPPGVWHRVVASETRSLSLNLKLTATPSIDGVLQIVRHLCLDEEAWRRPLPFASLEELRSGLPSEPTREALKEQMLLLSDMLRSLADDDDTLALAWFRNFLGSQEEVVGGSRGSLRDLDRVEIPFGVAPRLSVGRNGSTSLIAQAKILRVRGEAVVPLLREILARRSFRVAETEGWTSARGLHTSEVRQVLDNLVQAGFLRVVQETST
jgi:hypothetical protein